MNFDILSIGAQWTVILMIIFGFMIAIIVLLMNEMRFNIFTDVWECIGGGYKLNRCKGGIFKDSNGVRYFKSKKYGKNGKRIIYREPNNEIFADFENRLWGMPFLPQVQNEQIAFLNPFGETFIPVRRSFITIKRGKDLTITSNEDCEFCKTGVDIDDFLADPETFLDRIKKMDSCCEKHFTQIVNARYECIDQSDLSWMWKQIDDIKNEFGSFLMKFAPLIAIAGMFIFVAVVILLTYKLQPDIQEMVHTANMDYINSLKLKSVEALQNVTYPTN